MMEQFFKDEAAELIHELENNLVLLEKEPENTDMLNAVFRIMHTLKGSGGMFGYVTVSELAHQAETLFARIRDGKDSLTREIITQTLKTADRISYLVDNDIKTGQENGGTPVPGIMPEKEGSMPSAPDRTILIDFTPGPDVMQRGIRIEHLFEDLQALGTLKVKARVPDTLVLENLDPECCYLSWELSLKTDADINAVHDVFIFVSEYVRIREAPATGQQPPESQPRQDRQGPGPVQEEKQQPEMDSNTRKAGGSRETSLRVKRKKVDSLVDVVGEIITLQARFQQLSGESENPHFISLSENLERLSNQLQDITMSIRMVPIADLFQTFQRLVRDLNVELGKKALLFTDGHDTELDKNIIDALKDPLVHIVRNSMDHGIETPEERAGAGKDPQGRIYIAAAHVGSNIRVTIKDDGRGLDRDRIIATALERGIISRDEGETADAFGLIFHPGFSTKRSVNNISGRGVGMDVVKRNIERLKGTVSVESVPGTGTTITILIPLSLSIIRGLLTRVGDLQFTIDILSIDAVVEFPQEPLSDKGSIGTLAYRGAVIPFVRLAQWFGLERDNELSETAVIMQADNSLFAIVVDEVLSQHQAVIKPLSRSFKRIRELNGTAILGNGSISYIIDSGAVCRNALCRK